MEILAQTHTKNYGSQGQPSSDSGTQNLNISWVEQVYDRFPDIAYHVVIGNGGVYQTRTLDTIGWHAGNWEINKTSIGVCVLGNMEEEHPTTYQKEKLQEVIKAIFKMYGTVPVMPHSAVRKKPTLCCGKNLREFISKIYQD